MRATGITLLLGLIVFGWPAVAEQPEPPPFYAIKDVTVVTGTGETLDKATILIADGLIEAIGPDLDIPRPNATASEPKDWSAASASVALLAAALSTRGVSLLLIISRNIPPIPLRRCHQRARYCSISRCASSLSMQMKRLTQRYSICSWFSSASIAGNVVAG